MAKRMRFILSTIMVIVAMTAKAQVTTSSLSGKVTDPDKEAIIGATVQAIHEPSGTRYGAITNIDGRYTIQGMRAGGPYSVEVSYIGYQTMMYKDVTLQLGEVYNLNVQMKESSELLEEVVVTAQKTKFASEKTGATTNISNTQIASMPSVSRSITDYSRLSAYGGNGMSFAGSDGRTANFTIDGANFNNNFGLSSNLPGGGNPVSIEAIDEIQIVISPFDVRQTNFIGGGINAITKSGTNTYKGTAYIYHQNENMRGDAIDRETILGAREKDQSTTYGFTIGGPIIKNKLFFFANGELQNTPAIANRWRASEDGVANADAYISRATVADLQNVSDIAKERYGYDTGSFSSFPSDNKNTKLLARIDWNINNNHRLALRYNYTKNTVWNAPNASSMDGGTRMSGSRTSQYAMSYANSMYSLDNLVHSLSFDLNSRFSATLSNQFLATFSKLDDVRGTNSSIFPFVDILKDNQNYISFGEELFTYNNAVHNTVWNIKDDVTYYTGNHKIMVGLNYEHQMADNQYLRNGTGYYRYTSLDDFVQGAAPEIVCLTYGYNGENEPASRVQYNKLGFYLQDEWNVRSDFKVTAGLRFDGLFFDNGDLMTNNAILDLDYNGRHIDTGKWPGNSLTVSPRIGFSWDILGNNTLKLRGGSGLFSGRLPLVFFTNMPTNGGMIQYQAQVNAKNAKDKGFTMDEFKGGILSTEALKQKLYDLGYPQTIKPEDGTVPSSICGVDPDFKMPQVWKSSIAVDYTVPVSFPLNVTVEGIYNKTLNAAMLKDWSQKDINGFIRFNGADNRPVFPSDATYTDEAGKSLPSAYMLENTSRGYGWSTSVTVNAAPAKWINLMAAYTHTVSKEVTSLPGSNASSVLNYLSTYEGVNNFRLHNGLNVTPDRFIASATINDKSGNHFSLIYETWRGGYNYSYMLANDMNGDGYNYDAIYIPTDKQVADGSFRFVSEDDKTRFMDYVHNDSYLKNNQGKYAEPNSLYSPWVHRVDFSYKHDFNLNVCGAKHKLQLSFDMKNVLNFFNSSWGVSKHLNPAIGNEARILKYEGVDAEGFATFSTPESINGNTKTWTLNHAIGQCWYASIGIKYCFN